MAIPSGVCRISLLGHLGTTEIFDTSFWTLGGAGSQNDLDALVAGVATAIKATGAFTKTRNMITSACGYDVVRGYAYPFGGPSAQWVSEAPLDLAGSGSGGAGPYQMAAVVSLRTAVLGRRNRGRMYLPCNGIPVQATGLLDVSFPQGLADEWAALFQAINAIDLDPGQASVIVVSQTAGSSNVVMDVVVDNKPDIQRRRANRLAATKTATAAVI